MEMANLNISGTQEDSVLVSSGANRDGGQMSLHTLSTGVAALQPQPVVMEESRPDVKRIIFQEQLETWIST